MSPRRIAAPRGGSSRSGESGQTLVEFALVLPMMLILFMAIFELVLAMNASLSVSRASQHGAHVAASAGNIIGADCLILDAVENDLNVPNDPGNVSEVIIERTGLVGNPIPGEKQLYRRGGSTQCNYADGSTVVVPYSRDLNGYPESQRCTVLGGCPSLSRSTVDNISVTVKYKHDWITPLNGAFDVFVNSGGGWKFEHRNIFRIEPTL